MVVICLILFRRVVGWIVNGRTGVSGAGWPADWVDSVDEYETSCVRAPILTGSGCVTVLPWLAVARRRLLHSPSNGSGVLLLYGPVAGWCCCSNSSRSTLLVVVVRV